MKKNNDKHIERSVWIYQIDAPKYIVLSLRILLPPRFCACNFDCGLLDIMGFSCSNDDGLFLTSDAWFSVTKIGKRKKDETVIEQKK